MQKFQDIFTGMHLVHHPPMHASVKLFFVMICTLLRCAMGVPVWPLVAKGCDML
jgi:hypothetical protein